MQDKQNQGNQKDQGNQGLRQKQPGNQAGQQRDRGDQGSQQHGRDEGQMPNRNRTGVEEVPEGGLEQEEGAAGVEREQQNAARQGQQGLKGSDSNRPASGQHDQKANRGSAGQQSDKTQGQGGRNR